MICSSRLLTFIVSLVGFCVPTNWTSTLQPAMAEENGAQHDIDWWRHAVFYQIYPRSFKDSNADGVGDLRGIIQKLPHLANTGITAIWLSPIFESPMVDFGYDITDFKAVQPEYGTMQDFEALIALAHQLGIKILLDFVPNHTSDQCEWFKKSAERGEGYEDFYIWHNGKLDELGERTPPNNWQSVFYGSAWTWHEERQQFYLHQFAAQQPDLNYRNPFVVAAMDEVILFWLDKGVAGFRIDAVNHLFESADFADEPVSGRTTDKNSYDYTQHIYTKDLPEVLTLLQHWRQLLDNYSSTHPGPQRIMMTEAYAEPKVLMDYYEDENGVKGAHFPFNFDFITDLKEDSDARDFVFSIQKWLTYMPRGHVPNWLLGNHDNQRVASRLGRHRIDAMNMLLMTLPGVAITYNGEEIGMEDYRELSWDQTVDPLARNAGPEHFTKLSRDPERTPFQWSTSQSAGFSEAPETWLPVHPNYQTVNLAAQLEAKRSHYKVYKRLLELRREPALRHGLFSAEVLSRQVFALRRSLSGQATIITIVNVSKREQTVIVSDLLGESNSKDSQELKVLVVGVDSVYEEGQKLSLDAVRMGPGEGLVLEHANEVDFPTEGDNWLLTEHGARPGTRFFRLTPSKDIFRCDNNNKYINLISRIEHAATVPKMC